MNLTKKLKKINNQEGFSALLTLLIIGIVLTISLSISALMVSEIKMVGAYDDSVIAYYAADAGIEDSLLNIKNQMPLVNHGTAPIYTIDESSGTSEVSGILTQDQSAQVDLPKDNQPNNVIIEWTNLGKKSDGTTSTSAVEWTLITYVDNDSSVSLPVEGAGCNIDKGFYDGLNYNWASSTDKLGNCPVYYNGTSSPSLNKITIGLKGGDYAYKLRFKCLACTKDACKDAVSYSISYKISGDTGQVLAGKQTIGSTGQSGSPANTVKRKVTVDVDFNTSLNGIFDYVLYSEEPLYKPGS